MNVRFNWFWALVWIGFAAACGDGGGHGAASGGGGGSSGTGTAGGHDGLAGTGGTGQVPDGEGGRAGGAAVAPDEFEATPFDSTVILSEDALSRVSALDEDGTLHFDGTPPELRQIEPYQVLVAGASTATPKGLLKLVTDVDTTDSELILRTVDAPIQLAFRKLHVRFERSIEPSDAAEAWDVVDNFAFLTSDSYWPELALDEYAVNGDGDPSTPDDQVHIGGSLRAGFSYGFGLEVDWDEVYAIPDEVLSCLESIVTLSLECDVSNFIPEATVSFGFDAGADAQLDMQGVAFLPYEREMVLGEKAFEPVWAGPLLFFPHVQVVAKISGDASSEFHLSMRARADTSAEVSCTTSGEPSFDPPGIEKEFTASEVDATLAAHAKVSVGPRLNLLLFDVMGPYASLKPFARLEADSTADPCWHLYGGIEGDLGFRIATPDLPVVGQVELANFNAEFPVAESEVASGACTPLATGADESAAAGTPSDAAFAHPSFSPWARSYSDVVAGFPGLDLNSALSWSAITPTFDGRFLLTGSDATALLKVGGDGALVWAKRYVADVPLWMDRPSSDTYLWPSRAINMTDTGILVVAHPYTLLKIGQSGELVWAEHFDTTYRSDRLRLVDVARAEGGGYYLLGTLAAADYAYAEENVIWVVKIDEAGSVAWSKRFSDGHTGFFPRTLVPYADGVVVGGTISDEGGALGWGFAMRLDGAGGIVWATTLRVFENDGSECGSGAEYGVHPTRAVVASDGDIVFGVGLEAEPHAALFKLHPDDGSLAWFNSFGYDEDTHGPEITGLVALPSSGYLAAGTFDNYTAGTDLFVAGLDSLGRPQWSYTYGSDVEDVWPDDLPDDETYSDLVLTQDGGAIVAGYTSGLASSTDSLWALKIQAKDGVAMFSEGSLALKSDLATTQGTECAIQSAWSVVSSDDATRPEPLSVEVEDVDVGQTVL